MPVGIPAPGGWPRRHPTTLSISSDNAVDESDFGWEDTKIWPVSARQRATWQSRPNRTRGTGRSECRFGRFEKPKVLDNAPSDVNDY
jgi:hypothetical protein